MTKLSTHVLDTANGRAARGVAITLARGTMELFSGATDDDGRCPDMLADAALLAGRYRLTFSVADYFRAQGHILPDPPFLDLIVIDFAVADPATHHHVPLLVSPFGYSTYRGS